MDENRVYNLKLRVASYGVDIDKRLVVYGALVGVLIHRRYFGGHT
jgi:hypothetical protein